MGCRSRQRCASTPDRSEPGAQPGVNGFLVVSGLWGFGGLEFVALVGDHLLDGGVEFLGRVVFAPLDGGADLIDESLSHFGQLPEPAQEHRAIGELDLVARARHARGIGGLAGDAVPGIDLGPGVDRVELADLHTAGDLCLAGLI